MPNCFHSLTLLSFRYFPQTSVCADTKSSISCSDEWNCSSAEAWGTPKPGSKTATKKPRKKKRRRKTTPADSFTEMLEEAAERSAEEKEERRRRHYATKPTQSPITTEDFQCPHNLFTCKNKECILSKFRCNGKNHWVVHMDIILNFLSKVVSTISLTTQFSLQKTSSPAA